MIINDVFAVWAMFSPRLLCTRAFTNICCMTLRYFPRLHSRLLYTCECMCVHILFPTRRIRPFFVFKDLFWIWDHRRNFRIFFQRPFRHHVCTCFVFASVFIDDLTTVFLWSHTVPVAVTCVPKNIITLYMYNGIYIIFFINCCKAEFTFVCNDLYFCVYTRLCIHTIPYSLTLTSSVAYHSTIFSIRFHENHLKTNDFLKAYKSTDHASYL